MKRILLASLMMLSVSGVSWAQSYQLPTPLAPDDKPLTVWRSNDGRYEHILPDELMPWLPEIENYTQHLLPYYEQSFAHRLDQRASLVWASDNNQITNAYATQYPLQHNVYYRGSAPAYDSFAVTSWWKTLLYHEVAHLYQLNPKRDISKVGHMIFGNNPISILPIPLPAAGGVSALPIPAVTTPTMILPTWILEGNGVLNESTFGNGGRLFSGETYAIIYRLLNSKKVDERRMTNNMLDFPFGTEKYLLGGMINLYMAQKWGIDRVNRFFAGHAAHYFNPFRVNKAFSNHFGMSYSHLIEEALTYWRKRALGQQLEVTRLLVNSWSKPWPSRTQGDFIMALVQDQFHELPMVVKITGEQGAVIGRQRGAWPQGRVHVVDKGIMTSAEALVNRRYRRFSMWGPSERRLSQFDDLWVMDAQGDNWLAAHVPESFDEMILYRMNAVGRERLGKSNSSAMFAGDGLPIYFKQEGEVRTLMHGGRSLWSFRGHWSYPVDVVGEQIYFVAPTQYGAGLFVWRQGDIFRLGVSDAVLAARRLGNGSWLLVQVGPDGYEVGVTERPLAEVKARPYEIVLDFKSDGKLGLRQFFTDRVSQLSSAREMKSTSKQLKEYWPIRRMRFSSWNLMYSTSEDGTYINSNASFADPALYNTFDLRATLDNAEGEKRATMRYLNSRFLLQWGLYGSYYARSPSRLRTSDEEWGLGPMLSYHFWRRDQWNLTGEGIYLPTRHHHRDNHFNEYQAMYNLTLKRKRGTSLGLYPVTASEFSYQSHLLPDGVEDGLFYRGTYHLGSELFVDMDHSVTRSTTTELRPGKTNDDSHLIPFERVTFFGKDLLAARAGIGLKHPVTTQWYHRWWPLGVHRLSPVLIGNYWTYKHIAPSNAYEYGLALDVDVLLGHIASSTFQLSILNRHHRVEDTSVIFQYSGAF